MNVRIVISLSVHKSWPLYQLDNKNAFLYGDLSEDVYMTLPWAYHTKRDVRVCKLVKSLYGLKQTPRKWNKKLCFFLFSFCFHQSDNDYSLFVCTKNHSIIILLVYVDDVILSGSKNNELEKVKMFLKTEFLIKDIGKLRGFLGIEVVINTDKCVFLNQMMYCLELLHEIDMLGCKPIKTPLEANFVVSRDCDKDYFLDNITKFQKLVLKLIYLTRTRPYISYSFQNLSQFMHKPKKSHLNVVIRLLRYLKGSPGKGVAITKSNTFGLNGFVDVDWANCLSSRRPITSYLIYIRNSIVSWKSKKQSIVWRSSTESEYRALSSITCENIWILKVLCDLELKS